MFQVTLQQITESKKKKKKADFIHAIEERPVRRTAADAQAKVHQVAAAELHTPEGGNQFLNIL